MLQNQHRQPMRVLALALMACLAEGHGVADAGVASHWHKPPTPAGVIANDLSYTVEGEIYEGYVAFPPAEMKVKGGVLVAHQWMGLSDYEKSRSEEMAAMGYVALALDVYGKGLRCNNSSCGTKQMALAQSNVTKLRGLINAGANELVAAGYKGGRVVNLSDKLVAMGYCFGGAVVLELARHPGIGASKGLTFKAVSAIHGVLTPLAEPAAQGEIKTWVQAHHAELDFSGDAGLSHLEAELKVGVDNSEVIWETLKYAKCKHGFSELGTEVYMARAAVHAHKSTFEFFQMVLGIDDPEVDAFPLI